MTGDCWFTRMVGATGIEPVTPAVSRRCSPAELRAHPSPCLRPIPARVARSRAIPDDRAPQPRLNAAMDHPLPHTNAYLLFEPVHQTVPLVFASPHSGRNYPPGFVAATRLDPTGLRRSEDSFVEELFADVVEHGAPLLAATFPRAFCDPNREAWELDPAMFDGPLPAWVNTTSARVSAGLGTIARIVANGEAIYRSKLPFSEAEARIRTCWIPFHESLGQLITRTQARFGVCLLVDCHSMPSPASTISRSTADIVLGDAHGTSCSTAIVQHVQGILGGLGYSVRLNDPYAGGYITRHYGRPREGVHALQIELSRTLYMDEAQFSRRPGFTTVQRHLSLLAESLALNSEKLLEQPREGTAVNQFLK